MLTGIRLPTSYGALPALAKCDVLVAATGRALEVVAYEAPPLTKMDWNNDALYDPVPVSIRNSQRPARTIANVHDLPGKTYPYRLFMQPFCLRPQRAVRTIML